MGILDEAIQIFKEKEIIPDVTIIANQVKQLFIENKKREATELVASFILKKEIIYTTRDDLKSECWIYKDGIYIPQGRTYIKEYTRIILGSNISTYFVNEIILKIEIDTYIEQDELFKHRNTYLVCLKNGVYDLKKNILLEYSPNYFFFNKLPINYDENAECPHIISFFEDILMKESERKTMQELFGYLLIKDNKFEKMFMFTGSGRNGKGKSVELMKRFLGIENCTGINMNNLTNDRFTPCQLHNKMLNIAGDIGNMKITNTDILKQLRGRDYISTPRKFMNDLKFTNYAKLLFLCNEMPPIDDDSFGFWESWIYLEFRYTFMKKEEILKLYEEGQDLTYIKPIDTEIIEKISSDKEMSGLFNWAVRGLNRLLDNECFSDTKTAKEIKEIWKMKSDSVYTFVKACCVLKDDGNCSKDEFRREYNKYCKKFNLGKPMDDKGIIDTLNKDFGVVTKQIMGDSGRYWGGLIIP